MREDPHAARAQTIRDDLVSAEGATTRDERTRAMAGNYPPELRGFLSKVRSTSYRIAREDLDALRHAGVSEDRIYELTVAVAVAAASERLDSAKRAIGLAS